MTLYKDSICLVASFCSKRSREMMMTKRSIIHFSQSSQTKIHPQPKRSFCTKSPSTILPQVGALVNHNIDKDVNRQTLPLECQDGEKHHLFSHLCRFFILLAQYCFLFCFCSHMLFLEFVDTTFYLGCIFCKLCIVY